MTFLGVVSEATSPANGAWEMVRLTKRPPRRILRLSPDQPARVIRALEFLGRDLCLINSVVCWDD